MVPFVFQDDRVPTAQNGMRCCAFLMKHLMSEGRSIPVDLIAPFSRMINHSSNDVKLLVASVTTYLAKEAAANDGGSLPEELLKPLLPMLVNGTKEKNSAVRSR